MSKTTQQVYDDLIVEKNSNTQLNTLQPSIDSSQQLLADLNSPSRVAVWRLLFWNVSTAISTLYSFFDQFKNDVNLLLESSEYGSLQWYKKMCLSFQFGYALQWNGSRYVYSTIDTAAQIVKRAAVVESGSLLVIKVAKIVSNVATPLSIAELASFQAYINQIRYPGTGITIISNPADQLRISYNIRYDAQIPLTTIQSAVESAITTYISDLPFNSKLSVTKLTDAVQLVPGVIEPVFLSASARYGVIPFAGFTVDYLANSGHMVVDPATPLSSSITYTPYV
jgi:hypothetical protein